MNSQSAPNTRLHNRLLILARASWFAVLFIGIALYALSIPLQIAVLRTPCDGPNCQYGQITTAQLQGLPRAGLSLDAYIAFNVALNTIFVLVFVIVAAIIFWRKSGDGFGIYAALTLVIFSLSYSSPLILVGISYPSLMPLTLLWRSVAGANIGVFLYLFPDGRFVPRWVRWVVPVVLVREAAFVLAPDLVLGNGPLGPLLPILLASYLFAQVYRYRRVSNPVQRQQTKWFVFGIAGTVLGVILLGVASSVAQSMDVTVNLIGEALLFAAVLLIPVSLGMAILRSHLWDIDILIRRTLIYGALSAALALIYFGCVIVLEQFFRAVTGQGQSEIVIVLSTLAIAALFAPLRRRIQEVIDRRFYRKAYDAQQVLAAFGATVRDEVDLNKLSNELLAVVENTMQPAIVSLWLRDSSSARARKGLEERSIR